MPLPRSSYRPLGYGTTVTVGAASITTRPPPDVVRRPDAGSVLESPASTPVEVPVVAARELSAAEVVTLELMASLVSTDRRVSLISPLSLGSTGGEGQSRQHAQRRQPRELTSPEAHSHDLQPVRRARDRQHFARSAEPSAGGGEGR